MIDVSSLYNYCVGGLVSVNESGGLIENCNICSFKGDLGFVTTAGGVAGVNYGTINNCTATVNVTTSGDFGGIAGSNYGTISSCKVYGTINQEVHNYENEYENNAVGGIVGYNHGRITNCLSGGDEIDSRLRLFIKVGYVNNDQLAPYAGPIYGINIGGSVSGCSGKKFQIDTGNLHTSAQLANINNSYSA